jgi:hypothetical protein
MAGLLQASMEATLRREEKEGEGSQRFLGSPGGRRRWQFGRRSTDGGGIDGGSSQVCRESAAIGGDSGLLGPIPSMGRVRVARRS